MKHLNDYSSYFNTFNTINSIFENNNLNLDSHLNLYSLKRESFLINEIENIVPNDLIFNMHFDMAIKESQYTLTDYYRTLYSDDSLLLNLLKNKISESELYHLNESINNVKKILKNKLFEQDQENSIDSSELEDAIKIDSVNKSDGSNFKLFKLLKGLFNVLTEDGSTIGIIHFILDILGIVGDLIMVGTGIPLGLIADILNSIIYLFREKYTLATISFISGVTFGAGDILKGFKPVAKYADEVFLSTSKGANIGDAAYEVMKSIPSDKVNLFQRFLDYIFKMIGPVLEKISRILDVFINSFIAKVAGWLPILGKPLKSFFESIGKFFKEYADNMHKFSNDWIKAKPALMAKETENFIKAATDAMNTGGTIQKKGPNIIITNKTGNPLTFNADSILNSGLIIRRYPNGPLSKFIKNSHYATQYFNTISEINSKLLPNLIGGSFKIGSKTLYIKPRVFTFFVKQLLKIYKNFGFSSINDEKSNSNNNLENNSENPEIKAHTYTALAEAMRNKVKREMKKNPDLIYYVPTTMSMSDEDNKEMLDAIVAQQNFYAKKLGLPEILPASYFKAKEDGDEIPNEVDEFMKSMYTEKELNLMNSQFKLDSYSVQESLKFIIKYSDFI